MSLSLHRDPDKSPGKFTFFEAGGYWWISTIDYADLPQYLQRNVVGCSGISSCSASCRQSLSSFPSFLQLTALHRSASLGRTWSSFAFDLHNSDCRFPLDCHDSEILNEHAAKAGIEARSRLGAETPMTSLIVKMKLAVMAKKIVRLPHLLP